MWSWWTQWYTRHLFKTDVTYLNEVYHHDLVITLDKLPDIMKQYGKLQNQFQKPIRNSEPPALLQNFFTSHLFKIKINNMNIYGIGRRNEIIVSVTWEGKEGK